MHARVSKIAFQHWLHSLPTLLSPRFAYVEFIDKESVKNALALDESLFRGRQIKVMFNSDLTSRCRVMALCKICHGYTNLKGSRDSLLVVHVCE